MEYLRESIIKPIFGQQSNNSEEASVCLKELEAKIKLNYIISEDKPDPSNIAIQSEGAASAVATTPKASLEQFAKIELYTKDPADIDSFVKQSGYTHVIVAVDKSGSMSGSPMKSLKQALVYILEDTLTQEHIHVDIVTYNDKIHPLIYNDKDYKHKVENITAGGLTYFSVVFDKIVAMTKSQDSLNREVRSTVVIFMTDGGDTSSQLGMMKEAQTRCDKHLKTVGHNTIVHVVGFSKDHDFHFLNAIKKLGSQEGVFRYCEPSDGPMALKEKLSELYDYINATGKELLDIDMRVPEGCKICDGGEFKASRTLNARVVDVEPEEEKEGQEKPQAAAAKGNDKMFLAETWMYIKEADTVPEIQLSVYVTDGKTRREIPCKIISIERQALDHPIEKMEWSFKILDRNADILTVKVGEAIAEKKGLERVEQRLVRLQAKVSNSSLYNVRMDKDFRKLLLEQVKQIQTKLDTLHTMIADVRRGESDTVSMLARANDLRYQVQFSKTRRQRLMDQRVRKNLETIKKAQEALDKITLDKNEVEGLSVACNDFYMCTLSQMNVKEILLDPDDKEDCIGFGLAVKRAEHVLDEPTAIRIWAISGTLVSRSSMMDAIEHRINIDGHLMAHGGLSMDSDLGVATVGQSREPINAWLPMYVCDSHWQRVKALIKPSLGYFCTLDPLGYNYKQIDVLFQVLGSMIGQLDPVTMSEHRLNMIFGFQRLCAAVLKDFELIDQATEILKSFLQSPVGRTKDIVMNMYVLFGYILALPTQKVEEIFGKTECEKKKILHEFMLAVLAESLRRGAAECYRQASEAESDGAVHALIKENTAQNPLEQITNIQFIEAMKTASVLSQEGAKEVVKIPAYDFNTGVKEKAVTDVPETNLPQVDKAMEIWAQANCGAIRNKNRTEQVKKADKLVEEWIQTGNRFMDEAVDENFLAEEGTAENQAQQQQQTVIINQWDHLNNDTLQILIQLIQNINRSMHPRLGAITSVLAFLDYWITQQPNWQEMDANSGLPPDEWIQQVKKAINEIYTQIKATGENKEATNSKETRKSSKVAKSKEDESGGGNVNDDGSDVNQHDENEGGDDDFDEEDDEDSPEKMVKRQWKEAVRREPNLGEVLCVLCGADNVGDNQGQIVIQARGMVCQAVQFYRNSSARAGAADGSLKDFKNITAAEETLNLIKENFTKRERTAVQSAIEQVFWQRSNYAMLQAPTPWAFIGYLQNTYKDRGEGIAELVKFLTDPIKAGFVPHLADKIEIIVMGKWKDNTILSNGNVWIPEKKIARRFADVLGEEVWVKIELETTANVAIHVYRSSNKPNRHGHCNTNPYIPNALRMKLGMPLLKELTKPRTSKLRSKLTR